MHCKYTALHSKFLSVLQLVASIVFISFGVVASLCCAIVDGIFAARHIVSSSISDIPKRNPKRLYTLFSHYYVPFFGVL